MCVNGKCSINGDLARIVSKDDLYPNSCVKKASLKLQWDYG